MKEKKNLAVFGNVLSVRITHCASCPYDQTTFKLVEECFE